MADCTQETTQRKKKLRIRGPRFLSFRGVKNTERRKVRRQCNWIGIRGIDVNLRFLIYIAININIKVSHR